MYWQKYPKHTFLNVAKLNNINQICLCESYVRLHFSWKKMSGKNRFWTLRCTRLCKYVSHVYNLKYISKITILTKLFPMNGRRPWVQNHMLVATHLFEKCSRIITLRKNKKYPRFQKVILFSCCNITFVGTAVQFQDRAMSLGNVLGMNKG